MSGIAKASWAWRTLTRRIPSKWKRLREFYSCYRLFPYENFHALVTQDILIEWPMTKPE